jgi:hypothetical protein
MYEYDPYNQSFIGESDEYLQEPGNMPYNSYGEQEYTIGRQQPPFGGGQHGFPPPPPPQNGGHPGYPPQHGGQPGFPPHQGDGYPQGGHHDGPPTSPPPYYTPQATGGYNQGSIRRCLHRMTYVWLDSGRSFWFYPTSISRNSVDGYRWRQRQGRWVYFGIDRDQIRSFQCY